MFVSKKALTACWPPRGRSDNPSARSNAASSCGPTPPCAGPASRPQSGPDASTIAISSPGASRISSTSFLGSLTARLLPHLETCINPPGYPEITGYHRADILGIQDDGIGHGLVPLKSRPETDQTPVGASGAGCKHKP